MLIEGTLLPVDEKGKALFGKRRRHHSKMESWRCVLTGGDAKPV